MGGGGECQVFPSKISCLTVPKNFVEQPFKVSQISGIEKIYASGCYVTISVEFFCLTIPTNFVGEHFFLCCVSERFRQRISLWISSWGGGVSKISSNVFCLTVPNRKTS